MDYPWNLVDREQPAGARRRGGKIRDVRLDRPLGVAAEMEVVNQALAQGGHGILSGREDRI